MGGHMEAMASIREIIGGLWPGRFPAGALTESVAVGGEGLGLDSLEVVQLIFACEGRWGQRASEQLFTWPPLTIGQLAEEFSTQ